MANENPMNAGTPPIDRPGELTLEYVKALAVLASNKTYANVPEPYWGQILAAARLWLEKQARPGIPGTFEMRAKALVVHLQAAGEKLNDAEYVAHEIAAELAR